MNRLLFLFLFILLSAPSNAQIFPAPAYTPVTASSNGTIHTPASFFTANAPAIATAGFATQAWANSTFAPLGSGYPGFTYSLNSTTAQGSPIAASLSTPTGYYGLKITSGAGSGYPAWLESQGGQVALKLAQTTTLAADPILRLYRSTEAYNTAVNLMEVYNANGVLTSGIDGNGHFFPATTATPYAAGTISGNATLTFSNGSQQTATISGNATLSIAGTPAEWTSLSTLLTASSNCTLSFAAAVATPVGLSLPLTLTTGQRSSLKFERHGGWALLQAVTLPPSAFPLDGLIAHWRLDETTGTRVDATGHGYDLTPVGTVGTVAGKINNAADFTSTGSYLMTSAPPTLTGRAASFAFWFKTKSGMTGGYGSYVDVFGGGDNVANAFNLFITAGGGRPAGGILFGVNYTGGTKSNVTTGAWADLAWHLCVSVADGVAFKIYIDGSPVSTIPDFGDGDLSTLTGDFTAMSELHVNGYADWASSPVTLDSLSIWNRALTDAEVAALYNGGAGLDY